MPELTPVLVLVIPSLALLLWLDQHGRLKEEGV
jgi:hypothetical protein